MFSLVVRPKLALVDVCNVPNYQGNNIEVFGLSRRAVLRTMTMKSSSFGSIIYLKNKV
jgi:hypothetical protein